MRNFPKARTPVYFAIAMTIAAQGVDAQDRSQTRSMVISRNGIVAAESPLAAQAGARILERGGNAVDAAIAANAMMGGVEPMMNGIGGGFVLVVFYVQGQQNFWMKKRGGGAQGDRK